MPKHYPHGGSNIATTLKCRAWRQRSNAAPKLPEKSNAPAERGSSMHECQEQIVVGDAQPQDFLGRSFPEFGDYVITEDDVDQLRLAHELAQKVFNRFGVTELETEPMVEFSRDTGGSIDVIGAGKAYTVILDWKFGHRAVDALAQLAFYAMCAEATESVSDLLADKVLVLVTIQPALDEPVTTHIMQRAQFDEWKQKIQTAIAESWQPDPPALAGTHCRYCAAAPYCVTKREETSTFLALSTEQSDQLGDAMALIESVKLHIKAVEETVYDALQNAESVPGYKLVNKRARRSWLDEAAAEKKLRSKRVKVSDFKDSKIKSPTQIEKTLKKLDKDIDMREFITNASTGTTVAPIDDKRPAVMGKNQIPPSLAKILTA